MTPFVPFAVSLALVTVTPAATAASARIVVQEAPLAGFVHHEGRSLWGEMKAGDRLALVREPHNPHDANAIRIEWNGRLIGYVPRRENSDLARQLDHGGAMEARITDLRRSVNGRHFFSYEVYLQLK